MDTEANTAASTPARMVEAVTPQRHGQRRWVQPSNFAFAARQALVPVVGLEAGHAALCLPLAFVPFGDGMTLAALVGLDPQTNLFVDLDGRWLAPYVPAKLRSHPFVLAPTAEGSHVLCVDESSGLIRDDGVGELIVDAEGKLAAPVQQIFDFLIQAESSQAVTQKICAALRAAGVLEPWPLTVESGGASHPVGGLFRVSESALNALPDEAFLELRRAGGLPLAYAQLVSMHNLNALGTLAHARAQSAAHRQAVAPPKGDLDLSFMESDTLRFT
ncbi:MAG: SapC family protein [Burkholderiaceae bacterium]|nr:SapC family protein [Burkholderiaceae bacterium]MDO9089004.1 SapC family protein [Burkholderiaceae bacterium]MDP1968243.1 SapC family protein [Burkholderiaceae bacterium]